MQKSEFPSAAYLAKLREEGIFPKSDLLVRSFVALFVLLALIVLSSFSSSFDAIFKIHSLEELKGGTIAPAAALAIVPILAALLAAFLIGIFQTRFRLQALRSLPKKRGKPRVLSMIICGTAAGAIAAFFSMRYLLLLLLETDAFPGRAVLDALKRPLFICIIMLVAVAISSFIVSRVQFLYAHRISPDQRDEGDDPKVQRVN
jgi:flagellar biosynthesis protein FlhB